MFEQLPKIDLAKATFGISIHTIIAGLALSGAACTPHRYTIPLKDQFGRPIPNHGDILGEVQSTKSDSVDIDIGGLTVRIPIKTEKDRNAWKGVRQGDHFKVPYSFNPETNQLKLILPEGIKDKLKENYKETDPDTLVA